MQDPFQQLFLVLTPMLLLGLLTAAFVIFVLAKEEGCC
jgi:hypothetical protein